ncbi:MAG: hypothetical protein JSV36_15720 [Anaerolineae bacterium]|nr:MAG: hypothetical protein JSV36_15720 [Anaerolineae bacterium]
MAKTGRRSDSSRNELYNRLTTGTLALTVLVTIFYTVICISPSLSPIGGPKQEPAPIALLSTPTPKPTVAASPTLDRPPATWTPSPTPTRPTPTNTGTHRPTSTPRPTVFFTPIPTETGTPTATRHPYPFKLVDSGVEFMRYPFSSTCDWLGIAGEVVDMEGEPVIGIPVVLNGGGLQNVVTTSGDRPDYAPSGWEHFLDSQVKVGDFTIQLYRVVNNQSFPVSEVVELRTRQDCRANLAYVVFELAWEDYELP